MSLMNWDWTPMGVGWVAVLAVVVLVVYYVFMARAILDMLRRNANPVLLVFAFITLFPVPPADVMGIVIMIIWSQHKKAGSRRAPRRHSRNAGFWIGDEWGRRRNGSSLPLPERTGPRSVVPLPPRLLRVPAQRFAHPHSGTLPYLQSKSLHRPCR